MFSKLSKALVVWFTFLYLWSTGFMIAGYVPFVLADPSLTFMFKEKILKIGEDKPLVLFFNPGGNIRAFDITIKALELTRTSFVLAGPCYSACTFFTIMKDRPNVCATNNAMLHFHRARWFPGDNFNMTPILEGDEATQETIEYFYPKEVQDWIASQGGLPNDPDAWLSVSAVKFFKPCEKTLEDYKKLLPKK